MQENENKYIAGRYYVECGTAQPHEMAKYFECFSKSQSKYFTFDSNVLECGYGVDEHKNVFHHVNAYFFRNGYRKISRDELLEAITPKDSLTSKDSQDKKYYYLMAEKGSKPIFKHESYESALTEAERLIKTKQDIGFIEILECRTIVAKEIKLNIKTLI
jgi:hypothetical protein